MKGYYLFAPVEPACVGPQSGVERKVRAQHAALARHLDCELVIWASIVFIEAIVTVKYSLHLCSTIPGKNWSC